ncbi:MAG: AAA family ATPase [Chloroflexota bacterium]
MLFSKGNILNLSSLDPKHYTPLPRLVLVSCKPGSGKTTLSKELARSENLGLPLLSRDAIKAGLVETEVFAQPHLPRKEVETDVLRSTLVPASFDLFYKTMTLWLQTGVSLIAEYGFDQRSEVALAPIIKIASTVLIQCECPNAVAKQRFFEREQHDGKVRPDRLANVKQRIKLGTDPWSQFKTMNLSVPKLQVYTKQGYKPDLKKVIKFCCDYRGE